MTLKKRKHETIPQRLHWIAGKLRYFWVYSTEHLRRRFEKISSRLLALALAVCALSCTLVAATGAVGMVTVTDSSTGQSAVLFTDETDPAVLLQSCSIQLGQYDRYFCTAYEDDQMVITVQRAYEVRVAHDGVSETAYLCGGTVQDALQQLGITLDADDYVTPSLHTALGAGDAVQVHRVEYVENVEQTAVPYETEYQYTSLLYRFRNRSYTLRSGSDGLMETVYRERWVDGEMESSEQVNEYMVTQPVNELVLAYGAGAPVSRLSAPSGISVENNVPSSYSYVITNAVCTGYYSPTGRGSSRLGLYAGTVAVDPNEIPYGTLLYITSADGSFVYGWAIATDTGTALMEGSIDFDLFYETYRESCLNGKQLMNVYVVG